MEKIVWVGRTTMLAVGSAVTLAIVLGATTTALAAVPGDPFRLGQANGVDALTSLIGRADGALLRVQNTSQGSKASPSPALSLSAQPGNPALVVNPRATTANNLSADELDGKDSTAFANGTGGKANDADRLDGKDSAAFVSSSTGTAPNADKLDGKDSTNFASGTGGKANDADRLDGLR